MTDWRDARLQRALEDAPDREALPDVRTRQAVHEFAHKAVATPVVAKLPWWKKLWPDTGAARMPWNAALATVALATLVTVLWRDEPVPGAATESSQADRPATAKNAPPVKPAPAPPAPPPATAPTALPLPQQAPAAKPVQPPRARAAADGSAQKGPPAEPAQERRAEAAMDSLRDKQESALAKSNAGGAARGSSPARSDAMAEAAAPAPPAAAAPRAFARPASPALSAQTAGLARAEWTHVRIEGSGRSVELTREQAATLAGLLNSVERAARTQPVLDAGAVARIELRAQGDVLEVIELAAGRIRWQTLRGGRSEMVGAQPDPAQLRALQAEVDRLLGR
jgi:hypothetical protein